VSEGLQGRLEPCRHCATCPLSYRCDEGATEFGCHNEFTPPQKGQAGGRDVLHPLRPDLTERLWECGGLDIRIRTRSAQQPLPTLPSYIPRVQVRAGFEATGCAAVALPLDRVALSGRVRPAAEIRAALNVGAEAIVIVSSFQDDSVLERAWRRRRVVVESLASGGYDLVTVPNFSLWDRDPPLEHRYNIARSLRMFEMLVEAGVPTIPHVSWYLLRRDVDEWIGELRRWRGLPAFSLDLQTLDTEEDWGWGLRGLQRLFEGIGQDWEVLINGVAQRQRIREVREICGRIHIMNERPFQLAMSRHVSADVSSTGQTAPAERGPTEIFAVELQKMLDWVSPALVASVPSG
jgi:hypothetical protein